MSSTYKKLVSVTIFALLLSFCAAEARNQCCNDPCVLSLRESCDWKYCPNGGSIFEVDALIWKPCIDDLDFAAKVSTSNGHTTVDYKSLCLDWEAGVRFSYEMPCFYKDWGLMASYTILDFDDSSKLEKADSLTSPLAHQSFTIPLQDKITACWELCYHDWDFLLNYHCSCGPCHHVKPYFGVAGVFIEQKLVSTLYEDDDECKFRWHSRYRGYGPRLGAEYQCKMNQCMRFYSEVDTSLLVGHAHSKNQQECPTVDPKVKDKNCCTFVHGYHIGTGILYDMWICDVMMTLRIGYEFVHWGNLPNQRTFIGDNDSGEGAHATSSSVRNLGFHGVQAGLRMTF